MAQQKALILGATGLVGSHLLSLLLEDERYSSVTALLRKSLLVKHDKLQQVIVDFDQLAAYQRYFDCDHIFVCLGTTIKQAGSQRAFRQVDFELVLEAAKLAKMTNCDKFVWISSVGAEATSNSFYLKTKGDLEQQIQLLGLSKAIAVRPSLLMGNRKEFRLGEAAGIKAYQLLKPILQFITPKSFKHYLPIQSEQVAEAMLALANSELPHHAIDYNIW